MEVIKDKKGISLSFESVKFDFDENFEFNKTDVFFKTNVTGKIPTPVIIKGDRLLLPVDEGIAITAEAKYDAGEFDCSCIGGSFCSREGTMSMVIVERRKKHLLIALDNGTNAEYYAKKVNGLYQLEMKCTKECGVSYGIFNTLTEACKAYRKMKTGEYVTLTQKINKNSEIKNLVGGGIFWIWNDDYDKVMYSETDTDISPETGNDLIVIADELHKNGVRNALFGLFFEKDSQLTETLYKKYGYISTQYDNYNDVLNSELLKIIPNNRVKNCDYTYRRMKDFPDGVTVKEDGSLAPAWALKGFDGKYHNQNTLCPLVAHSRMKEEIPKILEKYPFYKGRFIDVYGGSISECYSDVHPMSREECLTVKNKAFSDLGDMGLIVGTEDGFEDILNNLAYTEGLHSPVYFRIKDAGRNHAHIYSSEQEKHIEKYMINPECRVPLWHLVYHECMIAFPYWGDSTEMAPSNIKGKILFSCLYGCAPLYSFYVKNFEILKEDIISSYKKISDIHMKIAELPMTDFQVLSEDYMIQKSVFGEKYEITVNFSNTEYVSENGVIPPKDLIFREI